MRSMRENSRTSATLAAGMVALQKARRISEFYFPFPYAQMLTVLLLGITFVQPLIAATFIKSPLWAGILTFIGVFTLWSISYVAQEIERPFGDSANDLPLVDMQVSFNASLTAMLETNSLTPPLFKYDKAKNQRVPVADGIDVQDSLTTVEDAFLPSLRNNTRVFSPARRSDSVTPARRNSIAPPARRSGTRLGSMAHARRDTIPARSDTRRGTRLDSTAAEGPLPSKKNVVTFAADIASAHAAVGDVEAGQPGLVMGGAAGTKPPTLIRKINPQVLVKKLEGPPDLERGSSVMSV